MPPKSKEAPKLKLAEVLAPIVHKDYPTTPANEEVEAECERLLAKHGAKFADMLPALAGQAITYANLGKIRAVLEPKG